MWRGKQVTNMNCSPVFFLPFSIFLLNEMSEGVIPELHPSSPSLTQKWLPPQQSLTLSGDVVWSIKQLLNMDDQHSPSNPKPPTQTAAANRENGVQRNKNTAEDVNTSKSYSGLCEWFHNILHKVSEWIGKDLYPLCWFFYCKITINKKNETGKLV